MRRLLAVVSGVKGCEKWTRRPIEKVARGGGFSPPVEDFPLIFHRKRRGNMEAAFER